MHVNRIKFHHPLYGVTYMYEANIRMAQNFRNMFEDLKL